MEQLTLADAVPSFETRMGNLDGIWRRRADDEKLALIRAYLAEAEAKFKKAVFRTTDPDVRAAWETMDRVAAVVEHLSGGQ